MVENYIVASALLLALCGAFVTWSFTRKVTYFYHAIAVQGSTHAYSHGLVQVPARIPPKVLLSLVTDRICEQECCDRRQVDVTQLNRV